MRYEFAIHTFGCKVNVYDSGLLEKRLAKAGGVPLYRGAAPAPASASADAVASRAPRVHVFNTCAVTAEATREAARAVRRVKAKDPFATVVVTGCAAQVDGAELDALPGVDLVVANSHKGLLESLLDRHFAGALESRVFRSNIFRKEDVEPGGGVESGHTRAFLKIQDGCNSFCTYCVIPFARGKSRSVPIADLVRRVNELVEQGAQEAVLTGVHIGDYEDGGGPRHPNGRRLEDLVETILERTKIARLRLTSLEPVELSERLFRLFETSDRLCPHFHMSVQAAQTRVLQAMRRNYGAEEVEWSLREIAARLPRAFVGLDVIAGFPGETEEEFAEGYERLARLPWTRIHSFPYSERPGTKAVSLEGSVPPHVRAARSRRLRELSLERVSAAAALQAGAVKRVLLIKARRGSAAESGAVEGLARDYWPVRFEGQAEALAPLMGKEIEAKIVGHRQDESTRMEGVLLGEALIGRPDEFSSTEPVRESANGRAVERANR